ncbi:MULTISPECIES: zinc ribbon domain-containing protein [Clostridium]|uniref:zinc ribbon domain-containing protein n=1 Tax=Clostridium TaxID=1485 RepID=UPI0013EE96C6|nr:MULTISPECIES: zinc ribbon domain-containing protein [Clostridium]MBN1050291.1 zinc ribbon domain-containing protein [Clostridium botulinum]MBZ9690692.1 zinc ribbon domain-containing protein [Clostridium sp. M14]
MEDKLIKLIDILETKSLAYIFKGCMESQGIRKYDGRKKDNNNSYYADGKCDNWNRVFCIYYKDSTTPGEEDLEITLRKRAGYYLIIERKSKRAVEVEWSSKEGKVILSKYDENLFNEIIKDHKNLFNVMFNLIGGCSNETNII